MTTEDPITHACRLLREAADELQQSHTSSRSRDDWTGEPEAKAAYDEHHAVQLAPAGDMAKLRGQRAVLCSLLGECLPVIDALMQMPGDDDSDARLNGLAGRITGALNALAEDQVKGGES